MIPTSQHSVSRDIGLGSAILAIHGTRTVLDFQPMTELGKKEGRMKKERTMKQNEPPKDINCYGCIRFFITHDRHYPYGCRAMGFKSVQRPSSIVSRSSGLACQLFTPKCKRP
jgi:hypothetical protein